MTRATGLSLSFPTATTPSKASVCTHQVKGGGFGPATVPAGPSCSPRSPAVRAHLRPRCLSYVRTHHGTAGVT